MGLGDSGFLSKFSLFRTIKAIAQLLSRCIQAVHDSSKTEPFFFPTFRTMHLRFQVLRGVFDSKVYGAHEWILIHDKQGPISLV